MKNNFRKVPTCPTCSHCINEYIMDDGDYYYCNVDNSTTRKALFLPRTIKAQDEARDWMEKHSVESNTVCNDYDNNFVGDSYMPKVIS